MYFRFQVIIKKVITGLPFSVLSTFLPLFIIIFSGFHPAVAAELPEDKRLISVQFKEQWAIVDDASDSTQPYSFAYGGDMYIAPNGHLYKLDGGRQTVYQFDQDGQYMPRYEFRRLSLVKSILSEVAVDSKGRVYVYNYEHRRIDIVQADGEYWRSIMVGPSVASMEIGPDDNLFISRWASYLDMRMDMPKNTLLTDGGPLIQRIDHQGRVLNQFCAPRAAGNRGFARLDAQGNIYFMFTYPYEIRKYNPQMQLVSQFSRDIRLDREPDFKRARLDTPDGPGEERALEIWDNLHLWHWETLILTDGTLMNYMIQRGQQGQMQRYFDTFAPDGTYIGAIPVGVTGLPVPLNANAIGGLSATDRNGNCYVFLYEEGQRILKKYKAIPVYAE